MSVTFHAAHAAAVRLVRTSARAFCVLPFLAGGQAALAQSDERLVIEEIVVTAQKREESINDVGMSIQAATGDRLYELGITDPSELYKVVSGLNSNVTYYGTTIYTIRGVGFQDTALASSPTVSVYLDENPLPYSVMTQGVSLDLQRVEVLKGPQGTLFGQNATGGAVNYVANKPTEVFESGVEASYGRFDTVDLQGFVSGPLSDSLGYRVAARVLNSGGWQKLYSDPDDLAPDPYWTELEPTAPARDYSIDGKAGDQDFFTWRASLLFEPNDRLSALFTTTGFRDRGDSQLLNLLVVEHHVTSVEFLHELESLE